MPTLWGKDGTNKDGEVGMTDRENVIRGLEQFVADFKPYCGNNADWQRVYDAIAMLKAQEPRLMTLEEVQQTKVAWLETHGWSVEDIHETVLRTDEDRYDFSDIITQFVDQEGAEIICAKDRYGAEWRCWTSRPDEKTMEATPWN